MNNKTLKIEGKNLILTEFETTVQERELYGLNVYMVYDVTSDIWNSLMPQDTLRDKKWTNCIYREFICGNVEVQLSEFLRRLNSYTGMNFHIASQAVIPPSIWRCFAHAGVDFEESVKLIVYGNNH